MRDSIINIAVIVAFILCSGCYTKSESPEENGGQDMRGGLEWKESDKSLMLAMDDEVVWQLNYDKEEDKPYFYPLRTLDGIGLALQRPADHPWHRGLWFSWKTVNEINYWEEDIETGLSPGRTLIKRVETDLNEDYSATIEFDIEYTPDGEQALMVEHRGITISSPDKRGNYRIDWELQFSAQEDVVLDREVPLKHGGVEWGGYAGLGFRANDTALDSIEFTDSHGWSREKSLTGYRDAANWMGLSGKDKNDRSKEAGLAIFDHPSNPRHPTTWYVWYEEGEHAFFMPAFLYDEPYELSAGESFTLRYRVLVHEGLGTSDTLSAEYQSYIQ